MFVLYAIAAVLNVCAQSFDWCLSGIALLVYGDSLQYGGIYSYIPNAEPSTKYLYKEAPEIPMVYWKGLSFEKSHGDIPIETLRTNIFGLGIMDSMLFHDQNEIGQVCIIYLQQIVQKYGTIDIIFHLEKL